MAGKEDKIIPDNILNIFGESIVGELVKELKNLGKDASGKLINSLDYRLQDVGGEVNLFILSEDYLEWVDKGRKPGSYPPISEISKWASLKGIPQTAVFPISYNIFKFGIRPTNVIEKSIDNVFNSNIFREFENKIGDNIEEEIIKKLNI